VINILFVGEKCNHKKSNIPFDKHYPTGRFLYSALNRLPHYIFLRNDFDFTNIFINNEVNISLKSRQYYYDIIIALGRVAEKELKKMNIDCKYIEHPSYFRRFRSKEGVKKYSQLILEVINGR
jgi:hypothetical protein